jgi:hypothetical protein
MRRIVQYVLFLFAALPLMAEQNGNLDITTLNWDELKIDSVLPVYTEVVPLQTDYSYYTYSVSIEYPEYAPLTPQETEVALKYDSQIAETINVESFVGVSRGEGMLDISFVPIIRRGNAYHKLVSAQIVITSIPNRQGRRASSTTKRYAAHSKLQNGRWVKISITSDGMYRLTRSALKNMGFSNPSKVHLYGYGGHLQNELLFTGEEYDDMVEVPLYYSQKQDAWLFWGNGLISWNGDTRVTNFYANEACYFLTEEAEDAKLIESEPSYTGNIVSVFTNFTDHVLYEKDEYAWYHGGRSLFENTNYANNNSHTYSLQTIDSEGKEKLRVVFSAYNKTKTQMDTYVNGTKKGSMILSEPSDIYTYGTTNEAVYDISDLDHTSNWSVRLISTAGQNARLDYLSLSYLRKLKPSSGYVAFSQTKTGGGRFNIEGTGLKVMRIGRPGNPATLIEGTQDGAVYSVAVSNPTLPYVAFDESYAFPEPKIVGAIKNQDLHAMDSVDMVIIIPTSGKLLEQAQRLADAHEQYDGLNCAIVYANQIYNEFSSGTPDATAYRRLMKMLYDKAENKDDAPKYLILFGDAAWDNRMISSQWRKYSPDDYLLCYPSENSFSDTRSFVMEDYFGLLDDGEGSNIVREKSDLGIGRFPVTSNADAKVMVDKTITYLSRENAGSWKNLVYLLGDDGDGNSHMKYADDIAELVKRNNPEMEVKKIMWDAYKMESTASNKSYPTCTQEIKRAMNEGAAIINYVGHAATYGMSHEFVLRMSDFAEPNGDKLALWVTAACDVMPFDGLVENIGETAILNPNGGALAFYGTARTVYAYQNSLMNRYFMQYLFAKDSKGRRYKVGDAIRLAKSVIISDNLDTSYRENKLQYALLGDPSLEFGSPLQRVVLDSINGKRLASSNVPLKAGQRVRLAGHLTDAKGDLKADFTGTMTARMYDNEETITCHNNQSEKSVFTFKDRTQIYSCQDSVINGKFDLEFVIPVDINNSNEAGRFAFYALNNERTMEADGYNERFLLGGKEELEKDTLGPQIFASLNSENFENGGVVNGTPYFYANLTDESGINYSGNGIGHDLILCVDNDVSKTYTLNNYYVQEFGDYTRGTVSYVLPELEAGSHTLTFRAWDVLNNTNAVSLDFLVDPTVAPNIFSLTASQNPARTSTNFLISYDLAGSDCTFTLEVFDFSGRRVWYRQEQGSSSGGLYTIPWNLCTNAGAKLFTGIYFYRCQMTCGDSKKVSKTQKIVVLNNK